MSGTGFIHFPLQGGTLKISINPKIPNETLEMQKKTHFGILDFIGHKNLGLGTFQ